MVVYGEGRYRCAEHGVVRPGPRAVGRPRRRPLRAAVPGLRRAARARRRSARTRRSTRATSTPRRSCTRSTCAAAFARETGVPVDRAALPQRLRPADAARHALRRRRGDLPLARWRPAARRGSSRTAASCATSSTSATSRAPTCWRSPPTSRSRARSTSAPGRRGASATWRARCTRRPARAHPTPWSTGGYRLGDVRHVFADPPPAPSGRRSASPRARTSTRGMAELARGPLGGAMGAHVRGSVLVVDDEPTIGEVVARYLERAGYETRSAADGPRGAGAVAEQRPDLIVLDLMLPGIDGLEVMRRLRARAPDARTAIILLTATRRGVRPHHRAAPRRRRLRRQAVLARPSSSRASTPSCAASTRRPRAGGDPRRVRRAAHRPAARRVARGGEEVALTQREFDAAARSWPATPVRRSRATS